MKSKLKILMVFSEVAPFAKTGGLADVGESLPKMLKDMGHDVRIITPQYMVTNERKYILRDVIRLQNIEVPLGKKTIKINVKSAFLPNSKVQVYFINYKSLFFREGLYVDPKSKTDYSDNDKRFALFNRGVLETLNKLQWQPDIIHCNDWQTGLIPFYLKTSFKNDLIAHWEFNEKSGNTIYDSSGNGFHGTIYGNPNWAMGKIDEALEFNEDGDYISITENTENLFTSLSQLGQGSISVWFKVDYITIVGDSIQTSAVRTYHKRMRVFVTDNYADPLLYRNVGGNKERDTLSISFVYSYWFYN